MTNLVVKLDIYKIIIQNHSFKKRQRPGLQKILKMHVKKTKIIY